jgi:hypothetical protein
MVYKCFQANSVQFYTIPMILTLFIEVQNLDSFCKAANSIGTTLPKITPIYSLVIC